MTRVAEKTPRRCLVHIRWMIRRDMPEVLDIENEAFEFPWPAEDFVRYLEKRSCTGTVAEHEDRVVGFMLYILHKKCIHVSDFAVAEDYRHRGIGTQMVDELIGKLDPRRRNRLLVQVRERNLAAQLFFFKCGFRAISVLHHAYDDVDEDAYIMSWRLRKAVVRKHINITSPRRAGGVTGRPDNGYSDEASKAEG